MLWLNWLDLLIDNIGMLTFLINFSLDFFQIRNALGTLMTEGFVVVHGDNVKRIWDKIVSLESSKIVSIDPFHLLYT